MVFTYALLSVFAVSLASFVGVFTLLLTPRFLSRIVFVLVSFSVGVLFGDVFIHIIPEVFEVISATSASVLIFTGFISFFVLEKFVHWRHTHSVDAEDCDDHEGAHHTALRSVILTADGFHNFIDGIIITSSYMVSVPLGIATTLAVLLHELPQEIGDFGILLHSGLSRVKALLFNFISALCAFLGIFVAYALQNSLVDFSTLCLAFAAGGFIYIAGSDLVPELHKTSNIKHSLVQLFAIVLGFALMFLLSFFE
ncbi:MAG: hypothetical protein RJA61_564 [Candidatus Parcubacteria bacterium]|jgi:zinc and cadmium transporter